MAADCEGKCEQSNGSVSQKVKVRLSLHTSQVAHQAGA